MKCARPGCPCSIEQGRGYDWRGETYCCETCAKQCSDAKCVCTPCGCPK